MHVWGFSYAFYVCYARARVAYHVELVQGVGERGGHERGPAAYPEHILEVAGEVAHRDRWDIIIIQVMQD